jgi:hypothetical protein
MPPDNAQFPDLRSPGRTALDRETAESHLALLANWRTGALATAIVMAVLLPVAIASRDRFQVATGSAVILGAVLATGAHVVRRRRLATIALSPELVGLADLAGERRRLQNARTRRALAAGLRRTADPNQPPSRYDPCPILVDRAQAARAELLELADTLEQTHTPDPASVALLRELLTNATSPLYNPNLPASELHHTLQRAHFRLTAQANRQPLATTTTLDRGRTWRQDRGGATTSLARDLLVPRAESGRVETPDGQLPPGASKIVAIELAPQQPKGKSQTAPTKPLV